MENNKFEKLKEYIDQFHSSKKTNRADLSTDQDLAIGIMNLIAIEEHLFFTAAKTKNNTYYDMIEPIRQMRKELLQKIIVEYEGEIWCTSKHLLTASMRMMEVGTKELSDGNKENAYDFFNKSYDLYMMFWALNINNKDGQVVKKELLETIKEKSNEIIEPIKDFFKKENKENLKTSHNVNMNEVLKNKSSFSENFNKLKDFISSKLDCCKE